MRTIHASLLSTALLFSAGCSTLNDSLKLGSVMGAAAGVAAVHAGHNSADVKPSSDEVTTGALIGLTAGLITAYATHKEVEKDRGDLLLDQPDIQFGDLPPSPFVFPKNQNKRGK